MATGPGHEAAMIEGLAASLDLPVDTAVRGLLRVVCEATGMESALLLLAETPGGELHQVVTAVESLGTPRMVIGEGAVFPWSVSGCRLLQAAGRTFSPDMQRDFPDFALGRDIGLRAYVTASISAHDGRFLGTVCGIHPEPMELPSDAEAVLRLAAALITLRLRA